MSGQTGRKGIPHSASFQNYATAASDGRHSLHLVTFGRRVVWHWAHEAEEALAAGLAGVFGNFRVIQAKCRPATGGWPFSIGGVFFEIGGYVGGQEL